MNENHYSAFAIFLHWLMALLLVTQFAVGVYMSDLPFSPSKLQIYSWHKWAGVTALLLVILRLAWRFTHRPPGLPSTTSSVMRSVAHVGHATLYILMVTIPISGWLMSSAKGFQTVYFGVLPLPDLLSKDNYLGDILQNVHQSLNFLFLAIVLGHVGAAFKHHFIDKDGVLSRMQLQRSSIRSSEKQ